MSRPNDPSRSVARSDMSPQGVTDEALDWEETVAAVCKGPHLHLGSADYAFAEDGEMGCALISEAAEAASRGAGGSGGERLAERLHGDPGIDAGGEERLRVGPGLRLAQVGELGDNQAAGESSRPWVGAVDGGEGARDEQAAGMVQLDQPGEMRGTRGQSFIQGAGRILADKRVKHDETPQFIWESPS